jgi:hydroxypyruvate isomerase
MPRFSANLSMLFCEHPFLDRFEHAAKAGFRAVEFQFPYAFPVSDIQSRLKAHGLDAALHNLPAGDWQTGERGIACHPARADEFKAGVRQGIQYAKVLGVQQLNCLVGQAPSSVAEQEVRRTLLDNLRYAARALQENGLKLLIEPINTFDVPGFFINRTKQASDLLDELDATNAYIQYDAYHAQRMEGELAATLQTFLPRIAHIQVADNPGRHEPGSGEINYAYLFTLLDRLGYDGWVGCEYHPATDTASGLSWRSRLAP